MSDRNDPSSMPRAAGVKDVAAHARVSIGTVSNVLNRPDRVAPSTRARVEEAIRALGFVRNESARQLRQGQSRTLAYLMLDASNPFFTDVAQGMEEACESHDLALFMCTSNNTDGRERALLSHLQEQRVQGVLVTPIDADSELLTGIAARGTPVVIVDRVRHGDDLCSVAVDDVLGGTLAIDHLIEQGHERVAFVGGPLSLGQVRDREMGARQAWAAAGLPDDHFTTLTCSALTVEEGRRSGERLDGLPSYVRPTAVFCANDITALGLLQHCISTGTRVPEKIAIVGYDDIEFAAAAAVPLTSVRQPRHQLGLTAAELVLDESANPAHEHRRVIFLPELVARASTVVTRSRTH